MTQLLAVSRLAVRYGASQALQDCSFELPGGQITALLGPNGAGKSSLARALCGLVPAASGSVELDGRDITRLKPDRIRRLGVAYLPEGRGIFPPLSVQDNLRMAVRWLPDKGMRRSGVERAYDLFPILAERHRQQAGTLSGGEQQMLSVGRGLAAWPRVLIADELSLGLAPKIVELVFDALGTAAGQGVAVLMIEQFVHRALELANSALVLRTGRVVWQGSAHSVTQEDLVQGYIGAAAVASTGSSDDLPQ